MQDRPFPDQSSRRPGLDVADRHFAGKVEFALLVLMLGVEVSRLVFLVVHPDDDSEEHGNDAYGLSRASSNGSSQDPVVSHSSAERVMFQNTALSSCSRHPAAGNRLVTTTDFDRVSG
jgi:hypothetical protein